MLKSGKWLNNPALAINKKNYTSDYILNKAAAAGFDMQQQQLHSFNRNDATTNHNNNDEFAKLVNTIDNNFNNKSNMEPSVANTRSSLPRRQLPQINNKTPTAAASNPKLKYNTYIQTSNSAQSVPELTRDNESFYCNNTESGSLACEPDAQTTAHIPSVMDAGGRIKSSMRQQRQPLIKQVSLNNPPTYRPHDDDHDEDLYENSSSPLKNKPFTSTQELRNYLSDSNQQFSSTTSSISQLNTSSRIPRLERLQDPLNILKSIRNSSSRLNSTCDLNELDHTETLATINAQLNDKLIKLTSPVAASKQSQLLLMHADSLSSDPSDNQSISNYQTEFSKYSPVMDEGSMNPNRCSSKPKRASRSRKQPPIPIGGFSSIQQQQQLKQQLLQKVLIKQNLKQHSLTSSDENLNDEFDMLDNNCSKKLQVEASVEQHHAAAADYWDKEAAEEECEDDDEIRSTTEYTTNDEMDLESGSVSLPAHVAKSNTQRTAHVAAKLLAQANQPKSIDDYLVQHLKKEELLAAKMSKFLSVIKY